MMYEELGNIVDAWCGALDVAWQQKMPEALSTKIKLLADLHPIHLYSEMEEHVREKNYDHYTVLDQNKLIDIGQPYRTKYNEIAYHVMQQYAMKRRGKE